MLQFIKIQYKLGRISADKVRSYVPKWLTEEQAAEIIGGEEQAVYDGLDGDFGGGYIRPGGDSGLRYKQSLSERKHKEFA